MPALPHWSYSADDFVARHVSYELVDDEPALARALEELHGQDAVGVDLEYTMHREHDRRLLRLIQLGIPGRQLLVDAQRVDARVLRELFAGEAVEKQLHAPSGDYEQWLRYVKPDPDDLDRWLFRNVFDTASRLNALNAAIGQLPRERRDEIARLAGVEPREEGRLLPLSVADLSELVLGFGFGRSHRHRWGQPTLTEAQLRYAALDVAVLPFLVQWIRALADELGVDLDAAAADEDLRNLELASDLALVPVTRRQQLEEAVKDAWHRAARADGRQELSGLTRAERSYLLRRYGKPRGRATLRDEDGRLVAATVPYDRRRHLTSLADRAPVDVDVRDDLEQRFLEDFLRRKKPELALEGGRLVPRA